MDIVADNIGAFLQGKPATCLTTSDPLSALWTIHHTGITIGSDIWPQLYGLWSSYHIGIIVGHGLQFCG